MSLIDDLRTLGDKIDPALMPTLNEVPKIIAALVATAEHGEDLFEKTADEDIAKVTDRLQGNTEDDAPEPVPAVQPAAPASNVDPAATAQPSEPTSSETADLRALVADLQAQLDARSRDR